MNANITPPENFVTTDGNQWCKWMRRFERYRLASGLAEEEEIKQISVLLYAAGEEVDEIVLALGLNPERDSYKNVTEALNQHFGTKTNIIFERAQFNKRVQFPGEPIEKYISDLHILAEKCNYGVLKDELIRDRIVVGINDEGLSEKMQLMSDLTLLNAKSIVKQAEKVKLQQGELNDSKINIVASREETRKKIITDCRYCGKSHEIKKCPAFHVNCHKCNKKGHFAIKCRNGVNSINLTQETNEIFLGAVLSVEDTWDISVNINGTCVPMKIDTGAAVTVVDEKTAKSVGCANWLNTKRSLVGPNNSRLEILGEINCTISYNDRSANEKIFIVKDLMFCLLGRPAIKKLEIVKFVGAIDTVRQKYKSLCNGLGKFPTTCKIELISENKPFCVTAPRRIPIPLLDKVQDEIKRMENLGVISKMDEPTEWVAPMVVVPKKNGSVRICVDYTQLNKYIKRAHYQMPSVDHTLAQINEGSIFTKLDANSGYWQMPMARESVKLTTFITPFGRYSFERMPFGLCSSPEIFQKFMKEILCDLPGVLCVMDDILIWGKNAEELNHRTELVFDRLLENGVTLNEDKCEIGVSETKFLGYFISKNGFKPDPDRIKAISQLKSPTNVSEVRAFLGMINQFAKFIPNLSERIRPLSQLLKKNNEWIWDEMQETSFSSLKSILQSDLLLHMFDFKKPTKISTDASSFGLGAVLLQETELNSWRPVAYASRTLTETEQRYAQIEKEALAVVFGFERFQDFVRGLRVTAETDHKPLIPLLNQKELHSLPPRILRFRLRLMKFDFTMVYVPGKHIGLADTLSRQPLIEGPNKDELSPEEVYEYVQSIADTLPASESRIKLITNEQERDADLSQVASFLKTGWPKSQPKEENMIPYWQSQERISSLNGLLLFENRIIIPKNLRYEIMNKIHEGHQGITKCSRRVQESVWWPGCNQDLKKFIRTCLICCSHSEKKFEPMMFDSFPSVPWCKVATDIFQWNGCHYLLTVDYFSRFIEIMKLPSLSSTSVITCLKSFFARHGIPEEVVSDNGPQYVSWEFGKFAQTYEFKHITSSPYFSQGNGLAERSVKTIKGLLSRTNDPYLALLAYRATPLANGFSPAELLFGRKIRSTVPVAPGSLLPKQIDLEKLTQKECEYKNAMRDNYNRRHRCKSNTEISNGNKVLIMGQKHKTLGRVVGKHSPRSYWVQKGDHSLIRRNRRDLRDITNCWDHTKQPMPKTDGEQQKETSPQYITRSGRQIQRPERYGIDP